MNSTQNQLECFLSQSHPWFPLKLASCQTFLGTFKFGQGLNVDHHRFALNLSLSHRYLPFPSQLRIQNNKSRLRETLSRSKKWPLAINTCLINAIIINKIMSGIVNRWQLSIRHLLSCDSRKTKYFFCLILQSGVKQIQC